MANTLYLMNMLKCHQDPWPKCLAKLPLIISLVADLHKDSFGSALKPSLDPPEHSFKAFLKNKHFQEVQKLTVLTVSL